MAITSNLYPPIVDTYMPAFLQGTTIKVYFSLSLFNSKDQIANAQVTVRNQLNNLSVLDENKYPSQIKLTQVLEDSNRTSDDKYYIEIYPEDIQNGEFKINQYYKIQIRFTSTAAASVSLSTPQAIDSWLTTNLQYFSEWSTVCLIRNISLPVLELTNLEPLPGENYIVVSLANIPISGRLSFTNDEETDSLNTYRIKFYDNDYNLLDDSGVLNTNDYVDINNIYYNINYVINVDSRYHILIDYTTKNNYSQQEEYDIIGIQGEAQDIGLNISAQLDEDNGRTKIKITRNNNEDFTGQIVIRRASNKDNFSKWEDIYIEKYTNVKNIKKIWYDYTIEYGIWYQYAVQSIDENGVRAVMKKLNKNILALFEDIFLLSENKQLKIKYNPNISNYKHTISESKVETIGNPYPFIRRNGYVDYIQFSLGGLIASAMDEEGIFTNIEEEDYQDYKNKYSEYNTLNRIPTNAIDFIKEKKFRDKVIKFLYNNQPKLFRSPTEGNLLIRLMDINFTPNQTLGRSIWSFTSNAIEVDKLTLDNLKKYSIYNQDNKEPLITPSEEDLPISPVKHVVFVDTDTLPEQGVSHTLYIYNNQIYIYNEDTEQFTIISVPLWNETNNIITNIQGIENKLYMNDSDLFSWNNLSNTFEKISVPEYEEE